jgi:hypothetical protein
MLRRGIIAPPEFKAKVGSRFRFGNGRSASYSYPAMALCTYCCYWHLHTVVIMRKLRRSLRTFSVLIKHTHNLVFIYTFILSADFIHGQSQKKISESTDENGNVFVCSFIIPTKNLLPSVSSTLSLAEPTFPPFSNGFLFFCMLGKKQNSQDHIPPSRLRFTQFVNSHPLHPITRVTDRPTSEENLYASSSRRSDLAEPLQRTQA